MTFGRIIIPPEIVPGKYKLRMNWKFQLNALRNIEYQFTTEEFEIK